MKNQTLKISARGSRNVNTYVFHVEAEPDGERWVVYRPALEKYVATTRAILERKRYSTFLDEPGCTTPGVQRMNVLGAITPSQPRGRVWRRNVPMTTTEGY